MNYTDEQIIKAIECCNRMDNKGCEQCPLLKMSFCEVKLIDESLDLINRQKAEIERGATTLLKKEDTMQLLNKEHQNTVDELQKAKAEIELLHKRLKGQKHALFEQQAYTAELQAETESFKNIQTTIDEFWNELQKLSTFKGKDKPTLEELLEYIEQVKSEARKEFAESFKDKLRKQTTWVIQTGNCRNIGFSYDDVFFGIDYLLEEMENKNVL